MPAISIFKNDSLLCRIGADGLDVISVSVIGDAARDVPVLLDASGGSFAGCNCDKSMFWELGHPIVAGDTLVLAFGDEAGSSHPARSVFEAVQGASEGGCLPAATDSAAVLAFEQRPLLHPKLAFEVTAAGEPAALGRANPTRPLLSFSLLWRARRPDIARLHFHNRSLRETLAHEDGEKLLGSRLAFGGQVSLSIQA